MSRRADAYLTIPVGYASEAGGWRWSHGCDAVEDGDGNTVALAEQLGQVLEGVFAAPPVPPFAFVLHLLAAMKPRAGLHASSAAFDWLAGAYAAAKPQPRNVGLLIAELCRGLPPFQHPPTWHDLDLALKRRRLFGERHRPELTQVPALGPVEFLRTIARRLAGWDDATLTHWLKFGGPPTGAGRKLAEAAESVPQQAGGLLDVLKKRERLVGAAALAPALDAALTLPPRRPQPDNLPQGGYVDVTSHGDPERLLPSQFALDGDEFVRRFAQRELLYFRREEPHKPTAPERWLVLDQGVRTWGPVRLGLAAGVVALLGKDPKRFGRPRLALTSHPEPFDPADLDAEELANRLEASDLTANPADALTLALDTPGEPAAAPRDVILFTHPRALAEGDVRGAVRLRRPTDRLFTVAVGDDGRAELGEWTAGGPVKLRSFRVDLVAAEAARVAEPARPKPGKVEPVGDWTGDVEPVPFPFRAGLAADVELLGFDADGEVAVVVGRGGVIHIKRLSDDHPVEVLPRAYRGGELLTRVEAVLGVLGGVVVCGRMSAYALGLSGSPQQFVAAHYDFTTRTVTVHPLGPAFDHAHYWLARPDLHCVAVRTLLTLRTESDTYAVDLSTGGRMPPTFIEVTGGRSPVMFGEAEGVLTARAKQAWEWARTEWPSPVTLQVFPGRTPYSHREVPSLLVGDYEFTVYRGEKRNRVQPLKDGKPLARGAKVFRAELAGDVLAVLMQDSRKWANLYLLRTPDGAVLGEFGPANLSHAFALSPDGSRLARQTGGRAVEVRDAAPGGAVRASLFSGGYHTRVHIRLDPGRLRVRVGRYEHTFALNEVPFRHERTGLQPHPAAEHQPWGYGTSAVAYDRDRFIDLIAAGPWVAGFDRWGQVVLLDRAGRLVMTVMVRRELAAAWLPDGTRWGSAVLLGGPAHPSAAVRLGLALQSAAEGKAWNSRSD